MSGFEFRTESVNAKPRFQGENRTIRWFPKATAILGAILPAAGASIALFRAAMLASLALNSFLLLVAMAQLLDDCVEGRWAVVPGVSLLALLFLLASASLSGYPFWKIRAWKDAA